METTTLASGEDAALILQLYDLRREPIMRAARHWVTVEFNPRSAAEIVAVIGNFGSQENQYLRQVTTYWEMAASFVLRGALDSDLFIECNGENTFILAKFSPFLAEVRQTVPGFLARTEQLVEKHAGARANLERAQKAIAARNAARH